MSTSEKRMRVLPSLRISDSLENSLMRLAARREQTLSAYIRDVLERHCFGHAQSLDADSQMFNDEGAMRGSAAGHGQSADR